jgi:alkylhydroperoxidase family enzyme
VARAIASYKARPLSCVAARSAFHLAIATSSVPNAVTDAMFAELRRHWSEEQIVEIVATIAALGFLNRWNTTMATPLEPEPLAVGRAHLAPHGWSAGIHER